MKILVYRGVTFLLASVSFACLLGEFYHAWNMRVFACAALLPAMALLAIGALTWRNSSDPTRREVSTLVIEGAIGGLIAAVAYDLYRIPFVLYGFPLFKVFPEFGKMLLGADGPNWLVQLLGWTYHFSNGAALGVMFTAMTGRAPRRVLIGGAVAWAVGIEIILLLTPYRDFFKIHMPFGTFLFLTGTAHLIFGCVLGWWCVKRIGKVSYENGN